MRLLDAVFAALFFAAAAFCTIAAWDTVSNLWAEYQDSPATTYLGLGAVWATLAVICLGTAYHFARDLTRRAANRRQRIDRG